VISFGAVRVNRVNFLLDLSVLKVFLQGLVGILVNLGFAQGDLLQNCYYLRANRKHELAPD